MTCQIVFIPPSRNSVDRDAECKVHVLCCLTCFVSWSYCLDVSEYYWTNHSCPGNYPQVICNSCLSEKIVQWLIGSCVDRWYPAMIMMNHQCCFGWKELVFIWHTVSEPGQVNRAKGLQECGASTHASRLPVLKGNLISPLDSMLLPGV